jgi:hypothetical protein
MTADPYQLPETGWHEEPQPRRGVNVVALVLLALCAAVVAGWLVTR